jgi:hypothetical protein
MQRGHVTTTHLSAIVGLQKPLDPELFKLARVLEK